MKKMSFEEFTKEVVEKIKDFLPDEFEGAEVSKHTITKNNNVKYTGITIRKSNESIAPTIYLEDFYEQYEAGKEIERILTEIAKIRIDNEVKQEFDIDGVTDFERAKQRIIPRLINAESNRNQLSGMPHIIIEDLAVTYAIQLETSAYIHIKNELAEIWNKKAEELHEIAIENMKKLNPSTFKGMNEIMMEMAGFEILPTQEEMWVLTNREKTYGASAILDQETMTEIHEKVGDFYILPSSLHEVIIIPYDDAKAEALEEMVKAVNEQEVPDQDRLSDSVYTYTKEGIKKYE